jgi:hypothetical protein
MNQANRPSLDFAPRAPGQRRSRFIPHWKPRNRATPSGKSTSQPPHGSPRIRNASQASCSMSATRHRLEPRQPRHSYGVDRSSTRGPTPCRRRQRLRICPGLTITQVEIQTLAWPITTPLAPSRPPPRSSKIHFVEPRRLGAGSRVILDNASHHQMIEEQPDSLERDFT